MKERSAIGVVLGVLVVTVLAVGALVVLRAGRRAEVARAETQHATEASQPRVSTSLVAPASEPAEPSPERSALAETAAGAAGAAEEQAAAQQASPKVARVVGRCVDASGLPVPEALVRCGYGEESAQSSGDGAFSLDVDLGGQLSRSHRLYVSREGYGSANLEVLLRAGETRDVGDLVLKATGLVSGRVLDGDGEPLGGASLAVEEAGVSQGSRFTGPEHPLVQGRTEEDGTFLLESPIGAVRVWAGGDGLAWAQSPVLEVSAGAEVAGLELVLVGLDAEDTIELVVLEPQGAPVPFADVRYHYRSGGSSGSGNMNADANGRLSKFLPTRATHTFIAFDPQGRYRPAVARDVPPGARGVELRLSERRDFRVRVRDAQHAPVERFQVALRGTEPGLQEAGAAEGSGPHPGGVVTLLVPVVAFRVVVEADGYELAELGPFEPEATPDPLLVTLTPLAGIRGRITGEGTPLAGASVSVHEAMGPRESLEVNGFPCRSEPYPEASSVTDADGRFLLTLRRAGSWYLRAEAPGFAPSDVGPLELDPRAGAGELTLDLGRGGRLTGRVLLHAGEEPSGWIIGVSRADGFGFTTRTDADGEYSFEGLTAGDWLVRWCREEISTSSTTSSRSSGDETAAELPWSCQVTDGRTTTFDLDLREQRTVHVAGTLVLGHAALAGWRAELSPTDSGARSDSATLDARGGFQLQTNLPGTFLLSIDGSFGNSATVELRAQLALEAGDNPWRRELSAGRIEGHAAPGLLAPGSVVRFTWESEEEGVALQASVLPRPEGTFELPSFPAGLVRVTYQLAIGESGESVLHLTAGETAVVTLP